ncbi:MAG: acetolactate synthase large subunit [Porticoccaceae bacterium]|nr:MAG: acetolactate synthase large subunit [Porticoccaceae bacterium]
MKKSGAWLTRYALESIGVTHTFGIPGEHNTEIYHELDQSEIITPCLVTHEASAAFMADAVSRTTNTIGTLVIVPDSGITHAASGIGEAFFDGIPMLVISGGVDQNSNHPAQQKIDLHALIAPITKTSFLIKNHCDIVPTIFEAYRTALEGEPGPVFIEIPLNLQLCHEETGELPSLEAGLTTSSTDGLAIVGPPIDSTEIDHIANMLLDAESPGIFVGWGAKNASKLIQILASHLGAPIATTLQGLSVCPASHPLHTGMGFGPSAVPAAQHAFEQCDCMLVVGARFSETSTGTFGITPPKNIIHLDINPAVFDTSQPTTITLQGDASTLLKALLKRIIEIQPKPRDHKELIQQISSDKDDYIALWQKHKTNRVNPANFFSALKERLPEKTLIACDDGNHTILTAELLPINQVGGFISPTGFNAMGYCVPAVNALKLTHPDYTVIGIVGDGAMLMSGMEAITANKYGLGVIYFLFNDGELGEVVQEMSYKRMTCATLGDADWISFAHAMGCEYVAIEDDDQLQPALDTAFKLTLDNKPVLVDVYIDYSKHTAFMEGTLKTKYQRSDRTTKARYLARALTRKIIGSRQKASR